MLLDSSKLVSDKFGVVHIDDKEYKRIANFKARALDPAIKQINEHTDIIVSYEQYKEGRKVAGFIFKFNFKDKQKEPIKTTIKDIDKTVSDDKPDTTKRAPKAIPTMTDKQRNTFANKLLNNFDFIRDYSSQTIGKSREELLIWVEQVLTDDETRQEWRKYILMSGYEFPDPLKS